MQRNKCTVLDMVMVHLGKKVEQKKESIEVVLHSYKKIVFLKQKKVEQETLNQEQIQLTLKN